MVEVKANNDPEQNDRQFDIKLPNNIRQMGTPGEKRKIYIEDYVLTYLNRMAEEKIIEQRMAILLGEIVKKENADIYFISAAVLVKQGILQEDTLQLSSEDWVAVYEEINHYFKDKKILGWFRSQPGQSCELKGKMPAVRPEETTQEGSLYYVTDFVNREDTFYVYESGRIVRESGYYIYYERNEAMQNYMVEMEEKTAKVDDVGVFQNRLFEKTSENRVKKAYNNGKQEQSRNGFMQIAAVFVILLVVLTGRNILIRRAQPATTAVGKTVMETSVVATGATQTTEHVDIVGNIVKQAEESAAGGGKNTVSESNAVLESNNEALSESERSTNSTNIEETEPVTESTTADAASATAVKGSYTVQTGDTLLKISRAYYQDETHVAAIIALNHIKDGNYIYPGMVLQLP